MIKVKDATPRARRRRSQTTSASKVRQPERQYPPEGGGGRRGHGQEVPRRPPERAGQEAGRDRPLQVEQAMGAPRPAGAEHAAPERRPDADHLHRQRHPDAERQDQHPQDDPRAPDGRRPARWGLPWRIRPWPATTSSSGSWRISSSATTTPIPMWSASARSWRCGPRPNPQVLAPPAPPSTGDAAPKGLSPNELQVVQAQNQIKQLEAAKQSAEAQLGRLTGRINQAPTRQQEMEAADAGGLDPSPAAVQRVGAARDRRRAVARSGEGATRASSSRSRTSVPSR
jgi:hypothetical protein